MMLYYHRRQEELKVRKGFIKYSACCPEITFSLSQPSDVTLCCRHFQKLEDDDDDSYLDAQYSDRQSLRKQFLGLTNIKWGPR